MADESKIDAPEGTNAPVDVEPETGASDNEVAEGVDELLSGNGSQNVVRRQPATTLCYEVIASTSGLCTLPLILFSFGCNDLCIALAYSLVRKK